MAAATEKTAEELRRELQELQRQHREITERLRDPRGLRRGAAAATGPGGPLPLRGFARPATESGDQPAQKRRLLSAVVKVDDTEAKEDGAKDAEVEGQEDGSAAAGDGDRRDASNGGFRRDGSQRISRTMELSMPLPEPLPREFPKNEDPNLVRRNKRMLGKLLVGTLEANYRISSVISWARASDRTKLPLGRLYPLRCDRTGFLVRRSHPPSRPTERASRQRRRLPLPSGELLHGGRCRKQASRQCPEGKAPIRLDFEVSLRLAVADFHSWLALSAATRYWS